MQFYTVSNDYISYLKTLDPKVPDNYAGSRPYVGIVLDIGGHKYLAPLTSYKLKQDKLLPTNATIFKIHEKGKELNKLGMLHINNMIPVLASEIKPVVFAAHPNHYQELLKKQIDFIKSNQDEIKKRALYLYKLVTVTKNKHFVDLSCNFLALETGYKNYTTK